jgi:hypothetical protein
MRTRLLALLLIGAIMTMPGIPTLPETIQAVPESPAVVRIGVVTDLVEADNITVRISGSPVLVRASYLFPNYLPVLGDLVYVIKQDAQWFVFGTMSGPINTLLLNPSFELGTVGATPTNWTITSVSAVAGSITFQKQAGSYLGQPMSGSFVGAVDFTSNGAAGVSQSNIISDNVSANEGERWAAALWITGGIMSSGTLSFQTLFLEFLDSGGAVLATNTVSQFSLGDTTIPRTYLRAPVGTSGFSAPPDTSFVRLRLNVQFVMPVPSGGTISTVFYDYGILRGPV